MKKWLKENREAMFWVVVCVLIIIALGSYASYMMNHEAVYQTVEFEIWECNAPWGRYWIEESGALSFHDADLTGTYIVKYLIDDNELITRTFDADDERLHVIITDNQTPIFAIQYGRMSTDGETDFDLESADWTMTEFYIYVPDPRVEGVA